VEASTFGAKTSNKKRKDEGKLWPYFFCISRHFLKKNIKKKTRPNRAHILDKTAAILKFLPEERPKTPNIHFVNNLKTLRKGYTHDARAPQKRQPARTCGS